MSTLDSSSTLVQVQASYADNASYAEDESATKCRAFITACILLIEMKARRVSHSGSEVEQEVRLIREELNTARAWLSTAASGQGGGVKHASFGSFRA